VPRKAFTPVRPFDKLRQVSQASIFENKHLGAVLSHIRERQIERAEARSQSAHAVRGKSATCSRSAEPSAMIYGECTVNGGAIEQTNFDTYNGIRPQLSKPVPHQFDGIVCRFRFSTPDET
jgi:hypothetical protein